MFISGDLHEFYRLALGNPNEAPHKVIPKNLPQSVYKVFVQKKGKLVNQQVKIIQSLTKHKKLLLIKTKEPEMTFAHQFLMKYA